MPDRFQLRNDRGDPVDPVPFVVAAATGLLVCYAWGPPYLAALGLALPVGVAVTTGVFLGVAAVSYHQLVWRARPDRRGEVPGPVRFRRLVYAVFALLLLFVLLALPLALR